MLEHKVSPLLDAMEIGECFSQHNGACCYRIVHPESGREFVLKQISVPASAEQVSALLLTGAYASEEEADEYYRKEAENLVREAEARKKLLDCPYILPFLGVQMEKNDVGYTVYAVLPRRNSLQSYLDENTVSHLRGINMGIDLCVALSALREEGYLHGNLKPGNVFFSDSGRFLLGDFGLISTQDLQYAILPEQYRSCYTAPELSGVLGTMNLTVDIYSLGMILYRIYNGNHAPFVDEQTGPRAAEARRLAGEELPAPIYADYELAAIIRKACAFRPEDRYQTPDEMRIELENYMRRNAVSDHLIVPPLVRDSEPLRPEEAEEATEPVRFADPETMDPAFKRAFAQEGNRDQKQEKRQPEENSLSGSSEPGSAEAPRPESPWAGKVRKRRKGAWIAFSAVMVLVVALIGLYEFTDLGQGLWHYFVTVQKLEVSEITPNSLKLSLATNTDAGDFKAYCQDAYGNSFDGRFENGATVFSGLTPNTQYKIKIELPGFHKISGPTSASAVTLAQTEITDFEASAGEEDGSVDLKLSVRAGDEKPAFWSLSFGRSGSTLENMQFAGDSCHIQDLEPGEEYVFRLEDTDNLYLAGKKEIHFVPRKTVRAEGLVVDSVADGVARLSWQCTTELPDQWDTRCVSPDGKELPVELEAPKEGETGWRCVAVVKNLVPNEAYTFTVSAENLEANLSVTLRDDRLIVKDFTVANGEEGLELHWSASREPEEGWRVSAVAGELVKSETVVHGESCVLAVLPDLNYKITIAPADGSACEGNTTLQANTGSAAAFLQLGVKQGTTIGTYYTPEKENWSYGDLGGGTVRYRSGDRITFVVTVGGEPVASDREINIMYVVSKAESGEIVNVHTETKAWNQMWDGKRWSGQIPWLPKQPGSYYFAVYLNSHYLCRIKFTLAE